jgi:hypothetical protein
LEGQPSGAEAQPWPTRMRSRSRCPRPTAASCGAGSAAGRRGRRSPPAPASSSPAPSRVPPVARRPGVRPAPRTNTWRPRLGRQVFVRGAAEEPENTDRATAVADTAALWRACLAVLERPDRGGSYRPAALSLWRVPDALARLRRMLPTVPPEGAALERFLPETTAEEPDAVLRRRAALARTLLAGWSWAARAPLRSRRRRLSAWSRRSHRPGRPTRYHLDVCRRGTSRRLCNAGLHFVPGSAGRRALRASRATSTGRAVGPSTARGCCGCG